jgi:Flp pilus assembly protein TadD
MRNRRAPAELPVRAPLARARRLLSRGDRRKALQTLRLACCDDRDNASLWVQYGYHACQCGKLEEARSALAQAAWLFDRRRQGARAEVVRGLLNRIDSSARAA